MKLKIILLCSWKGRKSPLNCHTLRPFGNSTLSTTFCGKVSKVIGFLCKSRCYLSFPALKILSNALFLNIYQLPMASTHVSHPQALNLLRKKAMSIITFYLLHTPLSLKLKTLSLHSLSKLMFLALWSQISLTF